MTFFIILKTRIKSQPHTYHHNPAKKESYTYSFLCRNIHEWKTLPTFIAQSPNVDRLQ